MNKRVKRVLCAVLAFSLAVAMAVPALSAAYQKQINVTYGISLEYNGVKQTLTDVNGNEVKPFVYQGTTYVPIRGVSYLFGADVGYDAETNTAVIYDDFLEVCGVVNMMSNIVTECYLLTQSEMMYATTKSLDDCTEWYNELDKSVGDMYETLKILADDNVNTSIILDEIIPYYQEFILSWVATHQAYQSLRTYQNSYYANKLADSLHETIDAYYGASSAISAFFNNYCMWRDLQK